MGGSSGDSKTTETKVTSEMSPEQRQIMQTAMGTYMPGGKFVDMPKFDPANPDIMKGGTDRVSPFSSDTLTAHQQTRDRAFGHDATMGQAKSMITGDGSGIQKYMNPYQSGVIDVGMKELTRQNQIASLGVNDAAVKAGAFGGSRHGVAEAETNRGYGDMKQKFLADTLDRGWTQATSQYNKDISNLGDVARTTADLDGQSINALAGIGSQTQQQGQNVIDAAQNNQMSEFLGPAQLAQMLSGFTPPPSTTQTSTASGKSGGNIWGSVGSAAVSAAMPTIMTAMFSDEDTKQDIRPADRGKDLDSIRKLAAGLKTYSYTDEAKGMGAPEGEHTNYIAQEREEITGEESPRHPSGYRMASSQDDISKLIGAVDELAARVDKMLSGRRQAA